MLMMEDSAHYLFYSLIFVGTNPATSKFFSDYCDIMIHRSDTGASVFVCVTARHKLHQAALRRES